jgi:HSP20 family protein
MANLTRFDPFSDMISLRGAMDRLFDESFVNPLGWRIWNGESLSAPVDVHQTNDEIIVTASLPGIKPEDVDITITGQTLNIRGEVHEDETVERTQYLYRERRTGTFSRTLELPVRVMGDKAEATFEHGLLRLTIPKAEEVKPRQIQIKVPTSETVSTSEKVSTR